jgi:hypothetical protein
VSTPLHTTRTLLIAAAAAIAALVLAPRAAQGLSLSQIGSFQEYPTHVNGTCVVTGGYVVRDSRLPALAGRYLYADLCVSQLRSLDPSQGGAAGDAPLGVPSVGSPASFGEGRGGVIFVVSLDGPVYRIDP